MEASQALKIGVYCESEGSSQPLMPVNNMRLTTSSISTEHLKYTAKNDPFQREHVATTQQTITKTNNPFNTLYTTDLKTLNIIKTLDRQTVLPTLTSSALIQFTQSKEPGWIIFKLSFNLFFNFLL